MPSPRVSLSDLIPQHLIEEDLIGAQRALDEWRRSPLAQIRKGTITRATPPAGVIETTAVERAFFGALRWALVPGLRSLPDALGTAIIKGKNLLWLYRYGEEKADNSDEEKLRMGNSARALAPFLQTLENSGLRDPVQLAMAMASYSERLARLGHQPFAEGFAMLGMEWGFSLRSRNPTLANQLLATFAYQAGNTATLSDEQLRHHLFRLSFNLHLAIHAEHPQAHSQEVLNLLAIRAIFFYTEGYLSLAQAAAGVIVLNTPHSFDVPTLLQDTREISRLIPYLSLALDSRGRHILQAAWEDSVEPKTEAINRHLTAANTHHQASEQALESLARQLEFPPAALHPERERAALPPRLTPEHLIAIPSTAEWRALQDKAQGLSRQVNFGELPRAADLNRAYAALESGDPVAFEAAHQASWQDLISHITGVLRSIQELGNQTGQTVRERLAEAQKRLVSLYPYFEALELFTFLSTLGFVRSGNARYGHYSREDHQGLTRLYGQIRFTGEFETRLSHTEFTAEFPEIPRFRAQLIDWQTARMALIGTSRYRERIGGRARFAETALEYARAFPLSAGATARGIIARAVLQDATPEIREGGNMAWIDLARQAAFLILRSENHRDRQNNEDSQFLATLVRALDIRLHRGTPDPQLQPIARAPRELAGVETVHLISLYSLGLVERNALLPELVLVTAAVEPPLTRAEIDQLPETNTPGWRGEGARLLNSLWPDIETTRTLMARINAQAAEAASLQRGDSRDALAQARTALAGVAQDLGTLAGLLHIPIDRLSPHREADALRAVEQRMASLEKRATPPPPRQNRRAQPPAARKINAQERVAGITLTGTRVFQYETRPILEALSSAYGSAAFHRFQDLSAGNENDLIRALLTRSPSRETIHHYWQNKLEPLLPPHTPRSTRLGLAVALALCPHRPPDPSQLARGLLEAARRIPDTGRAVQNELVREMEELITAREALRELTELLIQAAQRPDDPSLVERIRNTLPPIATFYNTSTEAAISLLFKGRLGVDRELVPANLRNPLESAIYNQKPREEKAPRSKARRL